EERSDPRGPYLRAELEWAKPWSAGSQPAGNATVSKMSAELDPLWVARVSRPPLGVCCDYFVLEESGPDLTPDDLARLDPEFHIQLPTDYRAFLLNHNGGHPYPIGAWFSKARILPCGKDYGFYPISLDPDHRPKRSLRNEISSYRSEWLPRFLKREPFEASRD